LHTFRAIRAPVTFTRKEAMLGLMLFVGGLGLLLLFTAPLLARLAVGTKGDPVGLKRIIWVVAAALLLIAIVIRPHNDETAAFPPSPDQVDSSSDGR
jgi:hypothetical protein